MSHGAGAGQVRGEDHPAAKLTLLQVRKARRIVRRQGPRAIAQLARRFGVARTTVCSAVYRGGTWQHDPGALRSGRRRRQ